MMKAIYKVIYQIKIWKMMQVPNYLEENHSPHCLQTAWSFTLSK